jgi:hypothetical protein
MHQLLDDELSKLGKENVVLWGARQCAAAALSSLLTWDGVPFAAVVGMSGWLPFDNLIWINANGDDSDCHGDEFWAPDTYWLKECVEDEDFDWPTKAVMYFRYELLMKEKRGDVFKQIPVFLGQSRKSEIVELGRRTKKCLDVVGSNVQMVEYESVSSVHGYSGEMLDDIFRFLRDKLGEKSKEGLPRTVGDD